MKKDFFLALFLSAGMFLNPAPGFSEVKLTNPKYEDLLKKENLGQFIKWRDTKDQIVAYPKWSPPMKDLLHLYLNSYESGQNPAGENPPTPSADNDATINNVSSATSYISSNDAWQIYLVHVAHALWLEAHQLVPWSLMDKTTWKLVAVPSIGSQNMYPEVEILLNSDFLFEFDPEVSLYFYSRRRMGSVTDWNPKFNYDFMVSITTGKELPTLAKSKSWSSSAPELNLENNAIFFITMLLNWARKNLKPIPPVDEIAMQEGQIKNQLDYLQALFGYRGMTPVDRMINPSSGSLRLIAGSWGATGFYSAILRSINFPVINWYKEKDTEGISFICSDELQSSPIFRALWLFRGDDPFSSGMPYADLEGYNLTNQSLANFKLLNWASAFRKFTAVKMKLDCDSSDPKCTKKAQLCYERTKKFVQWNVDYKSLQTLHQLCISPESLDNYLTAGNYEIKELAFVKPVSDQKYKDNANKYLKDYVVSLGGGDYEKGCKAVHEKYYLSLSPVCPGKEYMNHYTDFATKGINVDLCMQCTFAGVLDGSIETKKSKSWCAAFHQQPPLSNPKYAELLETLGPFIQWTDAKAVKAYPDWPTEMKAQLYEYLNMYEAGENPAGKNPPVPVGELTTGAYDGYFSPRVFFTPQDALHLYLVHVAHVLWVEAHQLVQWSMVSLAQDKTIEVPVFNPASGVPTQIHPLDLLLNSEHIVEFSGAKNQYFFSHFKMGSVTDWNPKFNYDFLVSLVKGTPAAGVSFSETWDPKNLQSSLPSSPNMIILKLTNWVRTNLHHIAETAGVTIPVNKLDFLEALFGYRGLPPVDKMTVPPNNGLRITVGCWGTTGLYNAILRSINIPVVNWFHWSDKQDVSYLCSDGYHSLPKFHVPDGLILSHGDDPYNQTVRLGNLDDFPSPELELLQIFYNNLTFENELLNPPLDCDSSDPKCTKKNQMCYNKWKKLIYWAVEHKSLYLLNMVCNSSPGNNQIDNFLANGGFAGTFAKHLFDEEFRQTSIDVLTKHVTELGGGNFKTGCEAVKKKQYLQNSPPCPGEEYFSFYKSDVGQCLSCKYAEMLQGSKISVNLTKEQCPGFNIK